MALDPVTAPPAEPTRVPGTPWDLLFGLSLKKRSMFFRELATMVEAAVSLTKAVRLAAQHAVPRIAEAMARDIEEGRTLSSALARYPYFFPEFDRSLVAAGEAGGTLDQRLGDLATTLERTYEMQQQVISRAWYPILVLHAAVFVPTLPLLVLGSPLKYAAATFGVLIPAYLLVFLIYAAYRLGSQGSAGRMLVDQALSLVPFLGKTLRTLAAARFLECLGQLYAAGMPVHRAVALAARSCGNTIMAARLSAAAQRVDAGETLTRALSATGALPEIALQMLATGEESGRLPTLLEKSAAYMHQEVEHTSQRVMTVLPILLMLIVGAVVGFTVIRFYVGQINAVMQF